MENKKTAKAKSTERELIVTHGFKGFDKNMQCRGKQYEPGQTYEESEAELCHSGMHFCKYPLDCFSFYAPGEGSRFASVEGEDAQGDEDDSKRVTKRLKVGEELSLQEFIEAAVQFTLKRAIEATGTVNSKDYGASVNKGPCGAAFNSGFRGAALNSGPNGAAVNDGPRGAASNSGFRGAALNSGPNGAAVNAGPRGAAINSGDSGAASNSGISGAALNSGPNGAAVNAGPRGAAINSGDSGAASNSGISGAAINSGDSGAASNSGISGAAFNIASWGNASTCAKDSVAVACGYKSKAKGNLGSWIVLAERNVDGKILNMRCGLIDDERLKADTFYALKDGEFIEMADE